MFRLLSSMAAMRHYAFEVMPPPLTVAATSARC